MFTKKNIDEFIKQAQNIQKRMSKIQKNIKDIEVTGESGAGLVRITINGTYNCKNVSLNKKILQKYEKSVIEDLIAAAFNDSIRRILEIQKNKLSNTE